MSHHHFAKSADNNETIGIVIGKRKASKYLNWIRDLFLFLKNIKNNVMDKSTILDFEKVGYLMLQIKKKYANTGMQPIYPVNINAFTPLVFIL